MSVEGAVGGSRNRWIIWIERRGWIWARQRRQTTAAVKATEGGVVAGSGKQRAVEGGSGVQSEGQGEGGGW